MSNKFITTTSGNCHYGDLINSDVAKIGPTLSMIRIGDNLYFTVIAVPAIFRISSDGVVCLFAGSLTVNGHTDGALLTARFDSELSEMYICAGGDGNIYLSEASVIRKINLSTGMVSTICGTYSVAGTPADGIGAAVVFYRNELICGPDDNSVYVYICDNCTIRRLDTTTGEVVTISGSSTNDAFVDGDYGVNRIGYIYGLVSYGNSSCLYALSNGDGGDPAGYETRILRISLTGPTYTVSSIIKGRSAVPVDGGVTSGKISYNIINKPIGNFQRGYLGGSGIDCIYFIEKGRIRYFIPDSVSSVDNNIDL